MAVIDRLRAHVAHDLALQRGAAGFMPHLQVFRNVPEHPLVAPLRQQHEDRKQALSLLGQEVLATRRLVLECTPDEHIMIRKHSQTIRKDVGRDAKTLDETIEIRHTEHRSRYDQRGPAVANHIGGLKERLV